MANEIQDQIVRTLVLKAPVARVWKALTDHREFGEWFRVKLEGPFVVGKPAVGRILYPGYEHIEWKVDVVKMDKEKLFAFHWIPYAVDPKIDYSKEKPTLVEFRIEPKGSGTLLTLTESGFFNVPAHRREEAFRSNGGGWTAQMENIRKFLED